MFQNIPLGHITLSGRNPRKTFDATSLDELADSIAEKGVIQPVLVRTTDIADRYELVCGERRFKASGIAKQLDIPCMVRTLSDDEALELMLMENFQRQDVHPIEEAVGFKQLQTQCRMKPSQIAFRVGKSVQFVTSRLRLSGLIQELHQPFFEGKFDSATAHNLAVQSEEAQREYFNVSIDSGYFDDVNEESISLDKAPFDMNDANYIATAGACVGCKFNSATGELFPEHATPMCMNTRCFLSKASKATIDKIIKAQSEGMTILYDWRTGRNELVMDAIKRHPHYAWNDVSLMEAPDEQDHLNEMAGIREEADDDMALQLERCTNDYQEEHAKWQDALASEEWLKGLLVRNGSNTELVCFKMPTRLREIKVKDIQAKVDKGEATALERSMAVQQLNAQIEQINDKVCDEIFEANRALLAGMNPVMFEQDALCDAEISAAIYIMLDEIGYDERGEFVTAFTGLSLSKLDEDLDDDDPCPNTVDLHEPLIKHLADKNGHISLKVMDKFQQAYTRWTIARKINVRDTKYAQGLFLEVTSYHFLEDTNKVRQDAKKSASKRIAAIESQIAKLADTDEAI